MNESRDMEDVGTPDSVKPHAEDYKHRAWTDYTLAELGQWIALLAKRSSHRSNLKKRQKDLYDARNYLSMLDAQVSHLEDELFETLCGLGECPPSKELENYIGGVNLEQVNGC